MSQEPIRRGDIFWVIYAFPHEKAATVSEGSGDKQRPVLILQNNEDSRNAH